MLNIFCWRCGTRIHENNILGLGQFNNFIGKYRGKGFVAFNCPKCNKTRYQILEANNLTLLNKTEIPKNQTLFNIDIDQVIDFHKALNNINTIENFLERCENSAKAVSTNIRKPILQPLDVYNLYINLNATNMKRLMILTLDKDNYIITWEFLGEGLNKPISFDPGIIFRTSLLVEEKVSVIIAQNLYNNFIEPTQKDLQMTKRLKKSGKILGIEFLDHIVIEKEKYHSYDRLNYI